MVRTRAAVAGVVVLALVACGGGEPGAPTAASGVRGRVTAGPTCPVERKDQPCPPRPVRATVDARSPDGRVVRSTRSDADGTFHLSLPAGRYRLAVVTAALPRCPETAIRVPPRQTVTIDVTCDAGIR